MPVDAVAWDSAPELLALAMALTGRAGASTELVGLVLAEGDRSSADPDPTTVRNLLVQRFVGRRPDSPVREAGPELPVELDRVAQSLDRLSPLQRAVLVLGYRERVTNAEIAGILDRPSATVERSLADAVATLDVAPTEIAATLDALAWQAPEPETVRPAGHRAQRNRRTRRRRLATLVGVRSPPSSWRSWCLRWSSPGCPSTSGRTRSGPTASRSPRRPVGRSRAAT